MSIQVVVIYNDDQPNAFIVDVNKVTNTVVKESIDNALLNKFGASTATVPHSFTVDDKEVTVYDILSEAQDILPSTVTSRITLFAE